MALEQAFLLPPHGADYGGGFVQTSPWGGMHSLLSHAPPGSHGMRQQRARVVVCDREPASTVAHPHTCAAGATRNSQVPLVPLHDARES